MSGRETLCRIRSPQAAKVGPFGGGPGVTMDAGPGRDIRTIQVFSGEVLDALVINDGFRTYFVGKPPGGEPTDVIQLDKGQFITAVSGKIVEYSENRRVSDLVFYVNCEKKYGPYGKITAGPDFEVYMEMGKAVGFFGRADEHVNSLGVYVAPFGYF